VVLMELHEGATVHDVFLRLGIDPREVSHVFVNAQYSSPQREVKGGDRLGIFPRNMAVLYRLVQPRYDGLKKAMFARIKRVSAYEYLQIVETYRRNGKVKQRMLASLGRYEGDRYEAVRQAIGDWQPLERGKAVLSDLEEPGIRRQGAGYFRKFKRWS